MIKTWKDTGFLRIIQVMSVLLAMDCNSPHARRTIPRCAYRITHMRGLVGLKAASRLLQAPRGQRPHLLSLCPQTQVGALYQEKLMGNSLAVQWLGLGIFTLSLLWPGFNPCSGNSDPASHVAQPKKRERRKADGLKHFIMFPGQQ